MEGLLVTAWMRATSSSMPSGFRDVVVGAALQNLNLLLFRLHRGHDHDWYLGSFANQAAGLQPGDTGHLHVEQNYVRSLAPQALQGFFAAARVGYFESARDEGHSQNTPCLGFIVDNQDFRSGRHGAATLLLAPVTGSDT